MGTRIPNVRAYLKKVVISDDYTVRNIDDIILASGEVEVTLQLVLQRDRKISIGNSGTNLIRIKCSGNDKIGSDTTTDLTSQYQFVNLLPDDITTYILETTPSSGSASIDYINTDITANYTVNGDDRIFATGTLTITLEPVANRDKDLFIANAGSGTITIQCYGAETIEGVSSIQLIDQYQACRLVPGNSNFYYES